MATGGRRVAKATVKEQRRMTQLMICGGLFILLVGIKILLPQTMEQMQDTLEEALTHNMDVASVFSIVGSWDDQDDGTEALQQAVFGEETVMEEIVVAEEGMATQEIVEPIVYTQENLPENVSMEQAVLGFAYVAPVDGVVTSAFGYREEVTEGSSLFHYGVDLAGTIGDPIASFADGTVRAVGESSSYGKYLIIDHVDGYATLYAHCDSIAVTTDATVTMGQTIATVGETGITTGPHLHLELMHNDVYLNPIYYVEG